MRVYAAWDESDCYTTTLVGLYANRTDADATATAHSLMAVTEESVLGLEVTDEMVERARVEATAHGCYLRRGGDGLLQLIDATTMSCILEAALNGDGS